MYLECSTWWFEIIYLSLNTSVMPNSLRPHGLQHTRLPCPSLSPGVCSNLCPLSCQCNPTISSSVAPFTSCPHSFPESGSFPMSQLFAPGGQSIGASAPATVLPMNIQGWSPLGLTGFISLLSKGLSRVFFHTTVWKRQFFGLSLHNRTWLLEKPQLWLYRLLSAKWCFCFKFVMAV